MFLPRYGANNQAGDLAPRRGAYSDLWRANLGTLSVNPRTVQGDDFMYHNYIGGASVVGVHPRAVVQPQGYKGSAPAGLQPKVLRSPPWSDPRTSTRIVVESVSSQISDL